MRPYLSAHVPVASHSDFIRVLHVEDDSHDAIFIAETLSQSSSYHCQIDHCKSLAAAQKQLSCTNYDVVLLDLNLPDSQGLNTIDSIRELFPDQPIVVLSGSTSDHEAMEAVRLGAQDYLSKETVDPTQVSRVIHHAIDRKNHEKKLMNLAFYDPVCGIPNRNLFINNLTQAMSRCDRTKERIALMFLDLDKFKFINDKWGHDAGDAVLREAAVRINQCVRKQDVIARLGGDEFTVILEGIKDRRNAERIARKILAKLSQPYLVADDMAQCSASIGISFYDGHIELTPDTLIKQTDIAMYRAKKDGRNTYKFFIRNRTDVKNPGDNISVLLDEALDRKEFHLHFQPQIDTDNHELVGAEALLRWNNKELGSVLPSVFIPLLEDSGQIIEVGEWVLHKACQSWSNWYKENQLASGATISVNISAVQFTEDIVTTVAKVLDKTGLPPSLLDLELTETTLLSNTQRNLNIIKKLKNLGISLTIDDFGTGFSSLPYLKHFCFDRLKVDRSYVEHVLDNSVDAAISSSIINLAENLDLQVVAEGVDSWDKVNRIKSFGCTIMQGYYYSRPLTEKTFLERYAKKLIH